ncbi:MAG: class I mannose-6-phosphate isomerase [Trueperaceae bacterium]
MSAVPRRATSQAPLPLRPPTPAAGYDLYPVAPLAHGAAALGWSVVAGLADGTDLLLVDGGSGVEWPAVAAGLEEACAALGRAARFVSTADAFVAEAAFEARIAASLGGDDPVFGRRFEGRLDAFVDVDGLRGRAVRTPDDELVVVLGVGAALADADAPLAYLEVPRNEQQYRARAGALGHVGASAPATDAAAAYKRLYFVEWPLLERHQADVWPRIDRFVDVQRIEPVSVAGDDLRASLDALARAPFRARPWFEPGVWGGQWLKERIPALPRAAPNYAWSFELITPENGLVFDGGGVLFETRFGSLMLQAAARVLGRGAARFGSTFPIRFDYLDTVGGGPLSVQCHPRPEATRADFGEPFAQDETYYIVDAEPDATVYLGFEEGVMPDVWAAALRRSEAEGTPIDVARYVRERPSRRGDLFLIPTGTVHASGAGNLVLEISSTPYLFTFKMYDWLRGAEGGPPRPLNVERALANLVFERQGVRADEELVARPVAIGAGPGWRREHLPTHAEHVYGVHRLTIEDAFVLETDGSPWVLALVAGSRLRLEAPHGGLRSVAFAETFVVPAAAGSVRLVNEGRAPAVLVAAFLEPRGD